MAVSNTKRKRVSKKNKLAWRKHTKVHDIEDFLDEQREEERLGVPLEIVSNDQFFVLDTKPSEQPVYSRQSRKLRATRPLKGFTALQPNTNVPDPVKKRNRVRTSEERKSELVKKAELVRRQLGILKAKEVTALTERRLNEIQREKKGKRGDFNEDVWNSINVFTIDKDPWAETITKVHNLRSTGIPVKKTIKDVQQKKSPLPAVEVPHPGMSYNPSYKDHQDLLRIVAEKETKIIKEEKHIERVTRQMFRKISPNQKQTEWMVEMSEGMPSKSDEIEIKEEQDEDLNHISINPPVKNKKKTPQQRRKQQEQLKLEQQRKALKTEKRKIGDIHRIKVLQKVLEKTEKKQEKLRQIRKVRAEKKKLQPKVLSSTKFEAPDDEFQMGEDISGNLRGLKKEGSLLSDRFKSLQKRNILEPSKRAHKKKPKVKKYTRPGYKDDWEKTIARANSLKNKINLK